MESLVALRKKLLNISSQDDRTVIGVWATDCLYNPANNGRIFQYKFLIVQTKCGQGCAYSTSPYYNVDELCHLVGKDCLSNALTDTALQVACLDAVAKKLSYNYCSEIIEWQGKSEYKLHLRSSLVVNEARRLVGSLKGKRILNVGVVGDMIKSFLDEGCDVIGTDFDSNIVGTRLFGKANVYDGGYTVSLLQKADVAVVTGMTLTTNSLDEIIQTCKLYNVKLIIFAETGANLGQYYVAQGVDVYIGEKYPFYIFDGKSILEITRKV